MKTRSVVSMLLAALVASACSQKTSVTEDRMARFQQYLGWKQRVRGAQPLAIWLDNNRLAFNDNRSGSVKQQIFEVSTGQVRDVKPGDEIPQPQPPGPTLTSPDKKQEIEFRDNNLYSNGKALTTDGSDELQWGPLMWSPGSDRVLAVRTDMRHSHHIPIIDYSTGVEKVDMVPYFKSGSPLPHPDLFVIGLDGKQVQIDLGPEKEIYLFPLGWREDGSEVLFMRTDRPMRRLDLMAADPATGKSRVIVTDAQKTFVIGLGFNPNDQIFRLPGNKEFLWRSERDGWAHFYRYDYSGKLLNQVTKGEFPAQRVVAADADVLYFLASAEPHPYERHLYRVGLDGRGWRRITEADGRHQINFSPDRKHFVDVHSSVSRFPATDVRSADGKLVKTVLTADTSLLKEIGWTPPEPFKVKAADGKTDIYGILFKPADFDPAKKYPVINYLYSGPWLSIVPYSFADFQTMQNMAQALAQLGCITYIVDGRGLPDRSKAFQDVTYGQIGRFEIADQVAALKELAASRPYMDVNRVGVTGASWGGYFATRAMFTAPDVYKVGVVQVPGDLTEAAIINEPYMGLPSENKEGYAYGSILKDADKMSGKLLLMHGTGDTNAPIATSMRIIDALVRANKDFDLFVAPHQNHAFGPPYGQYAAQKMARFFLQNLVEGG